MRTCTESGKERGGRTGVSIDALLAGIIDVKREAELANFGQGCHTLDLRNSSHPLLIVT
jgi:hypothetical protein